VKTNVTKDTFLKLTQCISGEMDQQQAIALFSHENSYLPIIKLANQYWLIADLTISLKRNNLWQYLNTSLQEYLTDLLLVYAQRAKDICTELLVLSKVIEPSDIPCILLKGSAALLNGMTMPESIRYMADIDILVPEERLEEAITLLEMQGFKRDDASFDINKNLSHHVSPMKRPEANCYVEVHRWPLAHRARGPLVLKDVWANKIEIKMAESYFYQLSPAHQIVLDIVHGEVSDAAYQAKYLNLQKLTNLYRMILYWQKQDTGAINWAHVNACFKGQFLQNVLQGKLYALNRFYGLKTPLTNINDLSAQKHVERCLQRYEKYQADSNSWFEFKKRFASYEKNILFARYGGQGILGLLNAARKQALVHFNKLVQLWSSKKRD